MAGSRVPPLTSLMISAPACTACRATSACRHVTLNTQKWLCCQCPARCSGYPVGTRLGFQGADLEAVMRGRALGFRVSWACAVLEAVTRT
eukprot:7660696-Pyramimonas_sp.AAC.1